MKKLLSTASFALGMLSVLPTVAYAQNAAIVNNKPISSARVDEFVKALAAQGRPDSPELRQMVREELIARELLLQEADKRGLGKSADVQKQLDTARQDIMVQALVRDYRKKNPVTDAEISAEYERVKKESAGGKEYKARHILVESEDVAKQLIDQLKKGAKFEDLAKQSKDPGSGANGGDLGWAPATTYVGPFAEAITKLEKGKMTEVPVKTQFGYHVIRLDDARDGKVPDLAQIKPQIDQELSRRKFNDYIKGLREKATIK
jgi:peptidyl-prolyl cis-trans isomerase C